MDGFKTKALLLALNNVNNCFIDIIYLKHSDETLEYFLKMNFNNKIHFGSIYLRDKSIEALLDGANDEIKHVDNLYNEAFNDNDSYLCFIRYQLSYRFFFENKDRVFFANEKMDELCSIVALDYPKIDNFLDNVEDIDLSILDTLI